MKNRILAAVLFASSLSVASGQADSNNAARSRRFPIKIQLNPYFELGGPAIVWSVNYSLRFRHRKLPAFYLAPSVGYFGQHNRANVQRWKSYPLRLNMGFDRGRFGAAVGAVWVRAYHAWLWSRGGSWYPWEKQPYPVFEMGVRFFPKKWFEIGLDVMPIQVSRSEGIDFLDLLEAQKPPLPMVYKNWLLWPGVRFGFLI